MLNDGLIDKLVGDLRPVQRPSIGSQLAILLILAAVELAGFLALGTMRPDMAAAMGRPAFWWKMGGLGILALLGAGVALRSFDPVSLPRRGLRRWGLFLAGIVLLAPVIDFGGQGLGDLVTRLNWRMGIDCLSTMTLLSIPPVIALGLMMRRGAPTDRQASAIAVGLTAAASGAFIFAFHCPSDDPLYILVWYALGLGTITLLARAILPATSRW